MSVASATTIQIDQTPAELISAVLEDIVFGSYFQVVREMLMVVTMRDY